MSTVVVFGAGKIARGFIGQLLYLSHIDFTFAEANESLAEQLRARGSYTVNILGASEKNSVVTGYKVVSLADEPALRSALSDAVLVFTSVGGKNLESLAPRLARCLPDHPVNVVTCENWKKPAEILAAAAKSSKAGFAEAVVMRSGIEANEEQRAQDPLWVNAQDFWRLPLDKSKLVRPLPEIEGLEPMDDFAGFLERKFYTYNAANGTVSYVGSLLGLTGVAEAAGDPRVQSVLEKVYLETGEALSRKYNIPLAEQMAFADTSRKKLNDPVIVDTLERNARDPIRKLGPDDRLVGSMRLAKSFGVKPEGLATAAAAAIHYNSPADPAAEKLRAMYKEGGAAKILTEVCKLTPGDGLFELVLEKEKELIEQKWIR